MQRSEEPCRNLRDTSVGGGFFSCVISLRTYQDRHSVINITMCDMSDNGCRTSNSHSDPVFQIASMSGITQTFAIARQRSTTLGHLHIAWKPSSRSTPLIFKFRENLFAHVAKESETNRQAKTRTQGTPYGLSDGTTTIRCTAQCACQWTRALIHGEAVCRPHGKNARFLRCPSEDVIRDTSGGLDASDGVDINREEVLLKKVHLPSSVGVQQV